MVVVYNPYIVVPLATWAVAQIAKFVIEAVHGRLDFCYLYASGGMPSVHSAVVCSLAATALILDGVGSHLAGLSVVFAAVVIYDSFGVRRSSGEQAVAINKLIANLDERKGRGDQLPMIREVLGHQPNEVLTGGVLGVFLAGLFNYQKLGTVGDFIQGTPGTKELVAYAIIFGLIVLLGIAQQMVLKARFRKSRAVKSLAKRVLVASQAVGWVGLILLPLQYERASYAGWRVWVLVALALGVVWAVNIVSSARRDLPAGLAVEAAEARKRRWLGGKRKR
jgi:acid phosphatase family membrane protein YuiD